MKKTLFSKLPNEGGRTVSHARKSLIPFLLLSLFLHLAFLALATWTLERAPTPFTTPKEERKIAKKAEEKARVKVKEREKLVYVKILDIPKPKREEKPQKAHIIAQYTMKRKGPKGKQERSSISGESSSLNFQPGLPITPPSPRITLVPGQQPVVTPKLEAQKGEKGKNQKRRPKLAEKGEKKEPLPSKGKGQKKEAKEGQKEKPAQAKKKEKSTQKRKKVVSVLPQMGPQTRIIPPLPKRKIPLFDPSLINEQSHKIVPQMGKGESQEISLDTTNSKYISYFKHIRDKLYLVWRYPLEARMSGIQGVVHILFVIERSGELTEVKLLKSSGFYLLDREAMRALRAAAPFGPFPPDWPDKELRIRARFIYRMFRSPFRR